MIAIVTEQPRFYYEAAKELKERKLSFLSFGLGEELPSFVKVVLTSEKEKKKVRFERVVAGDEMSAAVDECVRMLRGFKTRYKNLIIGVDPGLKPGVAVLGDNLVVEAHHLNAPEEVLETVNNMLDIYSGETTRIRVGNGGGVYRLRILKLLQENLAFPIETIDENSTTPALGRGNGSPALRDILAAINIALKEGMLLKEKVQLEPHRGEIKNLQHASRQLSGNITISRKLAERVAKGELTIEKAIRLHKNGKSR